MRPIAGLLSAVAVVPLAESCGVEPSVMVVLPWPVARSVARVRFRPR